MYSGRVRNSCSTSDTRRVTVKRHVSGITLIGYVQVKRMKSKTILNFENLCEPDRIANTCKGSYACS
jgi:hypothetical protein